MAMLGLSFPYCSRMDKKGRIIHGDLERRGPAFKRKLSQFNKASQTWEVFSETSTEEEAEEEPGIKDGKGKGKGGKGKGKPKVQRTRKSLDREWRQMRLAEAIAESEPGPKREILKGAMDVMCSGEPGCHLKAFRVASVVLT